jgi:hypothetical protein
MRLEDRRRDNKNKKRRKREEKRGEEKRRERTRGGHEAGEYSSKMQLRVNMWPASYTNARRRRRSEPNA